MTARLASRALCALLMLLPPFLHAGTGGMELQLSSRLHTTQDLARPAPHIQPAVHLQLADKVRDSILRELVLLQGRAMLGTDYVFGRSDSDAVDCSALMQRIFGSAGVDLPRTSREMSKMGRAVAFSEIEVGDLVFYRWKRNTLHVAIYVDEGRILHASPKAGEVVVTTLNDTWHRKLVAARRVI